MESDDSSSLEEYPIHPFLKEMRARRKAEEAAAAQKAKADQAAEVRSASPQEAGPSQREDEASDGLYEVTSPFYPLLKEIVAREKAEKAAAEAARKAREKAEKDAAEAAQKAGADQAAEIPAESPPEARAAQAEEVLAISSPKAGADQAAEVPAESPPEARPAEAEERPPLYYRRATRDYQLIREPRLIPLLVVRREYKPRNIVNPGLSRFFEELDREKEEYERKYGTRYWSTTPPEDTSGKKSDCVRASSSESEGESVSLTFDKTKAGPSTEQPEPVIVKDEKRMYLAKPSQESKISEGTPRTESSSTSLPPLIAVSEKYVDISKGEPPILEDFNQGHCADTEVTPRPSTPTVVSERLPISDFQFWDTSKPSSSESAAPEKSPEKVSAGDTSKPSSSKSAEALTESPPISVIKACLAELTADIPKLSPLSSAGDISRDAASKVDTPRQSSSASEASRASRKRLYERDEDDQEGPTPCKTTPVDEVEKTLAQVLSQVAQSPQRSPLRLPGTSRKRLLERDEEDQKGPTPYKTVPKDETQIQAEAGKLAEVASQVVQDEDAQQEPPAAALDEASAGEGTSMDTSKLSPEASMSSSKGASSTFEEDIYLPPDTFASEEEESNKEPTILEKLLADEAKAEAEALRLAEESPAVHSTQQGPSGVPAVPENEARIQTERNLAEVQPKVVEARQSPDAMEVEEHPLPALAGVSADDAPQPSSSEESDDDSSQSSPSGSPSEDDAEKEFKLSDTKMYLSSLPFEELQEVESLRTYATNVFTVMKAGRSPFSMFIDLFEDIIVNHRIMFESIKASDAERAEMFQDTQLKKLSKVNYTKIQEIEREIKGYISQDLNQFCYGTLEYIRATVHELDALNHAVYRNRGLTSVSNKRKAERIRDHVEKCQERNKSKSIRMKKNVVHVLSHYFNSLENQRLRRNFYKPFFENYKLLRESMRNLRRKYMPEGVVFSPEELTAPSSEHIPIDKELRVIMTTQMLEVYLETDLQSQCVMVDRSAMREYVKSYIAKEHKAEDNFQILLRQFVDNIPNAELRRTEGDSEEIQALKNILFRNCSDFVSILEKIGGFNFLIKTTLSILAKTLDLLLCLDLFAEKFIATEQASRQRIMNRPQQVEFNKRFDQYVAEIKNVVVGLQEYVYRKIISLQVKFRSIKNPNYGGAYNSFVDLCRLRVHKLDCINTDRRKYESAEYNLLTENTSLDQWRIRRAEVVNFIRSPFQYTGQTPLSNLPEAERQFVNKQRELYADRTYRQAVADLLSLCASVDSLEIEYQVKIQEIMSYVCPQVDDDAGIAAAAAAVVENVADSATVVLDVADAAVAAVDISAVADVVDVAAADAAAASGTG